MLSDRLRSDVPGIIVDGTKGQLRDFSIDLQETGFVTDRDDCDQPTFELSVQGSASTYHIKQLALAALQNDRLTSELISADRLKINLDSLTVPVWEKNSDSLA